MTEAKDDNVIEAAKRFTYQVDGWANFITGLGVGGRDKSAHNIFITAREPTREEVEDLYRGDAVAARIVDVLPGDMVREWFQLQVAGDGEDGKAIDPADANQIAVGVQDELRRLRARVEIKKALRWARLYGGSVVVIGMDEGDNMEAPVSPDQIKRVSWLKALHRYKVSPGANVRDVQSEFFGRPEFYTIHNAKVGEAGGPGETTNMRVHASRILRFDGVEVPEDSRRLFTDRWSDSVLMRALDALTDYQMSYRATSSLVHDFSQAVWGIPALHDLIASNQENLITRRIFIQDFARSIVNATMVDSTAGETFERKATPVTGLADLLDRQSIRLSTVTGMPLTLLTGVTPKGFATEDKSGEANWDDVVKSEQEEKLRPELEKLIGYILASREGPTGGRVPATWSIEFNALVQQTELEKAQLRLTVAQADALNIDRDVYSPDEAADSHYTSEGFVVDVTLDRETREAFAPDDDAPEAAAMAAEAGPDARPTDEEAKPQDQAMNGAQVKALQDVLLSVANDEIPLESAVLLVALAFPVSEAQARAMLTPAAEQETKPPPAPPPPFGVSPVSAPSGEEGDDDRGAGEEGADDGEERAEPGRPDVPGGSSDDDDD